MFKLLMYFNLVIEEMDVGHAHVLELDHFDGKPLSFLIVPNAAIHPAAKTTAYQVLEIEAVPADALLAFGAGLGGKVSVRGWFFGITRVNIKRTVSSGKMVGFRRCGDGDGDGHIG